MESVIGRTGIRRLFEVSFGLYTAWWGSIREKKSFAWVFVLWARGSTLFVCFMGVLLEKSVICTTSWQWKIVDNLNWRNFAKKDLLGLISKRAKLSLWQSRVGFFRRWLREQSVLAGNCHIKSFQQPSFRRIKRLVKIFTIFFLLFRRGWTTEFKKS